MFRVNLCKRLTKISAAVAIVGLASWWGAPQRSSIRSIKLQAVAIQTPSSVEVPADCSSDVSERLTQWFASLPPAATVEFPQDACYLIPQALVIRNMLHLTIEGNGVVFRRTRLSAASLTYPHVNAYLEFVNDSNLNISDVSVIGPNVGPKTHIATWSFEPAFAFYGGHDVKLQDTSAVSVGGDGLYLSHPAGHACVSGVDVKGMAISDVGRQGVALVCAHNVVLDDLHLNHQLGSDPGMETGIDLEPTDPGSSVVQVEIEHSSLAAEASAISAQGVGDVSDISIHDDVVTTQDPTWSWIYAMPAVAPDVDRSDWSIDRNEVQVTLTVRGMDLRYINGLQISGNVVHTASNASGAYLLHDRGSLIISNNDFGPSLKPITLRDSGPASEIDNS